MAGKSRVTAGEEQRNALLTLAHSRDRGEADRARAILLTLSGWTSPRIAEAFSVREDTVRLWRSEFARGGVEALKATVAPGPPPVKTEAALRVVAPLLEAPHQTSCQLRQQLAVVASANAADQWQRPADEALRFADAKLSA